MKKKILYVITKSNWGGAQRYVFDLAANLPKDKFETAVAAGGEGMLFTKLRGAGIRTINIPAFQRDMNILKEFGALWQLLRLFLREKPDIIHLNSSKAGGIGALAAFFYKLLTLNFKLLTVFTAHGWGFNEPRPKWQRLIIKAATRLASFFQDRIITICNADFYAAQKFIPAKKLILIPNGIGVMDLLSKNSALDILDKKTGTHSSPDTFMIGAIAELTKNKGITHLIDAIDKIRSEIKPGKLKVILIGDGEDKKELQNKINSRDLAGTIFIAGFIPDAARLLKAFDIFILPSLKEGLPYTLLEAMSAGIPSVATSVGGITDIIENGETGLLTAPSDPAGLKDAVKKLCENRTLAARLGQNASAKIKTKFSLTAMIEKTKKIYAL